MLTIVNFIGVIVCLFTPPLGWVVLWFWWSRRPRQNDVMAVESLPAPSTETWEAPSRKDVVLSGLRGRR